MAPWMMGEKFNTVYPHKGSIKALWETKWKFCVCRLRSAKYTKQNLIPPQCSKSIYPFHDGALEDFGPIFQKLIDVGLNSHGPFEP